MTKKPSQSRQELSRKATYQYCPNPKGPKDPIIRYSGLG